MVVTLGNQIHRVRVSVLGLWQDMIRFCLESLLALTILGGRRSCFVSNQNLNVQTCNFQTNSVQL